MAKTDNITLKLSLEDDSEHWLDSLASSLRVRGKKSADEKLDSFCQALEKRPGLAEEVRSSAWAFLDSRSIRTLLCEAGINWGHNFFDSFSSRLLGKVLPPPPREGNLQNSIRQAFDRTSDSSWLSQYSDASLQRLSQMFRVPADHPTLQKYKLEVLSCLEILSHRLAAMGLDPELVRNAPELEKYANPFLAQTHELADLMKALSAPEVGVAQETEAATKAEAGSDAHLNVLLVQCSKIVMKVQRQVKNHGTSMHLTFHLVTIQHIIERMQTLSSLISGRLSPVERWRFFLSLCIAENRRHSVDDFIKQHSRTIALQIVRQAGNTGGHYIAHNAKQLKMLFGRALGGGVVVAGIAMVKTSIGQLVGLPPLLLMAGYCGNYALGFILLHLLGFTLATKQPAMTAAALAAAMPDETGKVKTSSLDEVADLCLLTARSQFAAIMGNVMTALPVAMLISWLWQVKVGVPLASPGKAEHLLQELNPFTTPAVFYAALAGVGLYVSGLVSGYFDNLSNYYSIPDRIRHSPQMQAALGKRVEVWAHVAEHETGAIIGNASLGIYLGIMSALGPTLGIPLDIRHVTFAAANLGYVIQAEGFKWETFAVAMAGVALIGITNLMVSFGLALWTAASARGIGKRNAFRLLRVLQRRIRDKTEDSLSAVSASVLEDATRRNSYSAARREAAASAEL